MSPGRRDEPFEDFLPTQPGFIQDFVLGLFNSEVPVAYSTWAAVWLVGMVLKRDAHVEWFDGAPLFPNFYVLLSGPPSTKKGTAISRAASVYRSAVCPMIPIMKPYTPVGYEGKITEPFIIDMKTHVPIVYDGSTDAALKDALAYTSRVKYGSFHGLETVLRDSDGQIMKDEGNAPLKYMKTSEIGIITEELSLFLGRQKYNEGLVPLLLAIYNTDDKKEQRTKADGVIPMRNMFTHWIAGTTADSFQEAVSDTAKGDGFFSRMTIVFQGNKWQRFFPPPRWLHLPGVEDLATRLAYIAEANLGEHSLDAEAREFASVWYEAHCDFVESELELAPFYSRGSTTLLKLALIMKAQRYPEPGDFTITVRDLKDAVTLLEATMALSPRILETKAKSVKQRDYELVEGFLKRNPALKRSPLLKYAYRRGLSADELNLILERLLNYRRIEVYLKDTKRTYLTGQVGETYKWIGGSDEGDGGEGKHEGGPVEASGTAGDVPGRILSDPGEEVQAASVKGVPDTHRKRTRGKAKGVLLPVELACPALEGGDTPEPEGLGRVSWGLSGECAGDYLSEEEEASEVV